MPQPTTYLLESDRSMLEAKGRIVTYATHQRILSEGASQEKLFWIRSGSVRIELSQVYRAPPLARIGPGEIFGEMSFLDEASASATVTANEEVEVLEVDGSAIRDLVEHDDAFAARFYRTVAVTLVRRLRRQSRAR